MTYKDAVALAIQFDMPYPAFSSIAVECWLDRMALVAKYMNQTNRPYWYLSDAIRDANRYAPRK